LGLPGSPTTREERKLATVLFADLVGSTALAGETDPERVRVRLDRFYDAMAEEIERAGGTVEKFAGDAVMAAFGAPAALEDHAERALHAGLAMQRRQRDLFGGGLGLRIGVNTGEVVVGQARKGSSFVTGDAVNVCARLEQAAAAGEVLAGERTADAARGAFEFGELRTVDARGKPNGVSCRPVLRALTLVRPRGVGALREVFVGRESERDLLKATFRHAVSQGEPHLVTVVGEPGVGKTRLVGEFWAVLAEDERAPLRRTGRCLPYGDGITYWPLGEVVRDHFGIRDSDPPQEIRRKLEQREMLGLVLGLDVAGDLHPLDAYERLQEAAVAFIEELAEERPAVVLVEDLHWAEDDLLNLLERVLRDARAPVLLLVTARPELFDRRAAWGSGRRNATTIWLEPLAATDIARLLDGLLGLELPDALRDRLVERSEGNPFFIEELVGALVDAKILEREGVEWHLGEVPEGFSVPDSVHSVLAARLDALPQTEKVALQAASVVGRIFWGGAVIHLLDGREPNFALLEERDFVRRRSGSAMASEREYAIKHALTQEVAYASIPKARRGRQHAAFADWLTRTGHANDEHASLLAHHYAEAVRPEDVDLVWADDPNTLARLRLEAVTWLQRAGELARARYEIDEAIALFTRATEIVDDPLQRAELWREIGVSNALKYDGLAFSIAMQRSLDAWPDPEAQGETFGLMAFNAATKIGMWRTRPEQSDVRRWIDRGLELSKPESTARARALIAQAFLEATDEEGVQEAIAIAERTEDVELYSWAFGAQLTSAFIAGRFDESVKWTSKRLELAPEIGDPDHLAELYAIAVPVCVANGRFEEAHRLVLLQDEINQRLTPHHEVHGVSVRLEFEELLGDWDAIVELRPRTEWAIQENLDTPCVRNMRSLLVCAAAAAVHGEDTESRALERHAEEIRLSGFDSMLRAPRIRLALMRRDRSSVEALVAAAFRGRSPWYSAADSAAVLDGLAAVRDLDNIEQRAPHFDKVGTYFEPFALRALGVARRDDDLLARADNRFAEMGLIWHRAQTEALLAGLE
jgi:class 3 adenylate cyclase